MGLIGTKQFQFTTVLVGTFGLLNIGFYLDHIYF